MIITLCGSTRFPSAFELANLHLSLAGHAVLSVSCFGHADVPVGSRFLTNDGDESTDTKKNLDALHYRKILLSDAIFVVNVGGYIGNSTKNEIAFARENDKKIIYMFSYVY